MKSGLKFDNLAGAVGSFLSEGLESGPPLAEVSGLITQIKQWVVTAELWSQNLFVFTSKPGVMINWQKLDQQHQSSALQSSRLHQHSHSPLYRFVYLKIFCKTVTRFLLISSHFFLRVFDKVEKVGWLNSSSLIVCWCLPPVMLMSPITKFAPFVFPPIWCVSLTVRGSTNDLSWHPTVSPQWLHLSMDHISRAGWLFRRQTWPGMWFPSRGWQDWCFVVQL